MILETAKLNRVKTVYSKATGEPVTVKFMTRSSYDPKMDVFLIRETGRCVWRDSLRRRYTEA